MDRIEAWLEEDRGPSEVRRTVVFTGGGAAPSDRQSVEFLITGAALPPPLTRADIVVPALIFLAMRRAKPLHIKGAVSRTLLDNIYEFQAFWSFHFPDVYRTVEITAESLVSGAPRYDGAVVPFSGGVDSTFTVRRHQQDRDGPGQRRIKHAFLIHGFDIPLDDQQAFDVAATNAQTGLASINLPLAFVKTNWKSIACEDWEMEHGAGIVCCAYNFSGDVGYCLVAAGEDYKSIVIPWGANPVTNWMLSSHDFRVDLDGAAHRRVEKVAAIADWQEGAEHLRVCWEGPITGSNCGRCPKCMLTQLEFMAVGRPVPPAFRKKASLTDIFCLYAWNVFQLHYIEELYTHAKASGRSGAWLVLLRFAIFRSKYLPRPFWALRQRARRIPWLRRMVRSVKGRLWNQADPTQHPGPTH